MKNRVAKQIQRGVTILALVLTALLLVIACAPSPTSTPTPSPTPSPTPTPTPMPVLETLTYTNSEYGFSVEYPKDWDYKEGFMGSIVMFAGDVIEEIGGRVNIYIGTEEKPELGKVTLEEYVRLNKLLYEKTNPLAEEVDEYDAVVDDISAKVIIYTWEDEGVTVRTAFALFLKENNGYVLAYGTTTETYDDYVDCFELMLSTFKFD